MRQILSIIALFFAVSCNAQGIDKTQLNGVKTKYTLQMRGQNGNAYDFADGIPIPDECVGGVIKEVKVMRNDLSSGGTATVTGQMRIVSFPNATTWTQSYSIASNANGSNTLTYNPNTTITSTMKSFELTSNTASNQVATVVIIIEK